MNESGNRTLSCIQCGMMEWAMRTSDNEFVKWWVGSVEDYDPLEHAVS